MPKNDDKEDKVMKVEEAPVLMKQEMPVPPVLVSFERWFASTGKPDHWIHGMRVYCSTSGLKSLEQWNKLFASY